MFRCAPWVVLSSLFPAAAIAAQPPNFVIVLADDLGAAELGCYGHPLHETPRLDSLAREGMRFETCWATPLCTPTRVMLMTGQFAARTGYFHMYGSAWSPRPGTAEHEIGDKLTFADVLKARGYATALTGKWQLSGGIPDLIHDCGFDTYRIWAYEHNLPQGVKHTGRYEGKSGRTARYWHPCLVENGKYLPTRPEDYGPDLMNAFAIDFIRTHADKPFCLYYTMPLTHSPFEETPDPARPGSRLPGNYRSNLEYLDHLLGQLIDSLESVGAAANTVFIFVGDNGTQGRGKGSLTEMGVRVPLIVRFPGRVKPGVVSRELVSVADLFPTVVELAGGSLPAGHVLDGKSLAPTLFGEAGAHREWVFSYLGRGRLIRDERFVLELPGGNEPERLLDAGDSRSGSGYRDVTASQDERAQAARHRFAAILADLPGPEGRPGLKQPPRGGDARPKGKKKAKKAA